MIKTYALTHLALAVADPDRSLRFYSAVFGVREYFRDAHTVQVVGPGPHEVSPFERRPATAGTPGGIINFGFRLVSAGDINAAVAAVENAGGTISSKGEFGPGLPYAFARDPDG
jgi:catechol 2,3-dioxygenase-like lactoylglutathione lyase family enzyme